MTKRHLAGFLILHIIGAAGLYVAWRAGLLVEFFTADKTGMTIVIAGVAGIGIGCAAWQRWDTVEFISRHLPTMGLLGTVVGFSMAIAGLGEDFDIKMLGLHTALNTSLAGMLGHLWLSLNEKLLK